MQQPIRENYVYIHTRNDTGEVFYVGRGKNYRAWSKSGRNKHWTNIYKKYGITVEIVEDKLTLDESNQLEILVIELAKVCGCDLVNKTSGGDGCSDLVFNEESKVKMSRSQGGKIVHCSNGMSFLTGKLAADWCIDNGNPLALSGHISACCRGERTGAYGFAWWYDGDAPKEYTPRYERLSDTRHKGVYCSNGMWFKTQKLAAEWLSMNGHPKASQTGVGQACRGILQTAYGYTWEFGRND